MNSVEVTATEASTLEAAYTSNPYSSGSASFSLSKANMQILLNASSSATICVMFGRDSNGKLKGVLCSVDNSDGSLVSSTAYFVDGSSISATDANTLISNYDLYPDSDTPDSIGVYFERSQMQSMITSTSVTSAEFTFARESDDTLNVVATNDLGTVYFNKGRGLPKSK